MKLIQFDDRFHHLLISGCRNKYLTQMLGLVYDQNTRIRILSGKLTRRLDETYLEHMRILDCLLDDDTDGAAGAILEHLQNSEKAAFDCLYRNS